MTTKVVQSELAEFLSQYQGMADSEGRPLVVRNGYLPPNYPMRRWDHAQFSTKNRIDPTRRPTPDRKIKRKYFIRLQLPAFLKEYCTMGPTKLLIKNLVTDTLLLLNNVN